MKEPTVEQVLAQNSLQSNNVSRILAEKDSLIERLVAQINQISKELSEIKFKDQEISNESKS
jgi:hypothetical protein